jgi:hypothetical protein
MKAVTASKSKIEIGSKETAILPKPKKMAVKAAAGKVETRNASQEGAKPSKADAEKAVSKKVTNTVATTAAVASKVGKPGISKSGKAQISVAKSVVVKPAASKPKVKKTSATTSSDTAIAEPSEQLVHKRAGPSRDEIEQMIAKAAYFRAEKRCFEVGYEQEDWLMAEQEIKKLYSVDS